MKTLYTLAFIILLSPAFAQVEVTSNEIPKFQGVVSAPGQTADQLYNSLREWVALSYNSAQNVLQMDDAVAGKIVVKGIHTYNFNLKGANVPNQFDYTLLIELKDDRFRYTVDIVKATTGTGDTEILQSLILADQPYDPATGKPYPQKYAKHFEPQKAFHIKTIEDYTDALVTSMAGATQKLQAAEDW